MKKVFTSACLLTGMLVGAPVAHAGACGRVTIASFNVQSAEILANLDKIILEKGYGCQTELTVGDTVPTITSMVEKGAPDITPEAWIDLIPTVVKRGFDSGKLVSTTKVLTDGGVNGWWIPKYLADAHPEIKTIADMLKRPDLFPDPENPKKGAIFNGAQGWGWTIITSQLYKAFQADKAGFRLIDTGSAAGLDGSLIKAYEHHQGWVGYYWSPTSLLGKYPMVRLQPGVPYNAAEWNRCITVANCPDPKPTGWSTDHVVTLIASASTKRMGPDVMKYLNTRSWSNDTVNKLMAWMTARQATGDDAARYFLKNKKDIWTKWVSPDAAAKINSSL